MYAVGDTVQDFTLPNQNGEMITLSQYRGKKSIGLVLPKSQYPWMYCRRMFFTRTFDDLTDKDVVVLGISMDSVKRQGQLREQTQFPI